MPQTQQSSVVTGEQYAQPAATQPAQTGLGGNTLQSATSAPGQQAQYPQPFKWRNTFAPGNPPDNNQGATGQGSSSSTREGEGHSTEAPVVQDILEANLNEASWRR
ncbi:hypothetical protein V8E52_006925 [Russula decolorans]